MIYTLVFILYILLQVSGLCTPLAVLKRFGRQYDSVTTLYKQQKITKPQWQTVMDSLKQPLAGPWKARKGKK